MKVVTVTENLQKGAFYYVVTPNGSDPKRQYLYELKRPEGEFGMPVIKLSPIRSMAKKFDNIVLARAFCSFLHRVDTQDDFCVVAE